MSSFPPGICCYACAENQVDPDTGWPVGMTHFIMCPDCGNKRCPKASNHELACTNSNDINQPGSIFRDDGRNV